MARTPRTTTVATLTDDLETTANTDDETWRDQTVPTFDEPTNGHDAYRITGYDFKGNIRTLDKFGSWKPELREMRAHVAKLPLEAAIEQAAEDAATEDDDSEDQDE